jgi:CheY-like chemotaxis protein
VKFTDHGEVMLRVQRLSADTDRRAPLHDRETVERIRFEVEDQGIGMSREQLARLFQPFEQVSEERRREGGTGLGLAISHQLIRLMGGKIQVRSKAGKGSTFYFDLDLPVAESHAAALKAAPNIRGYDGRRRTILIVDDVALNRVMLMDTLDSLGFDVAEAGDGQECLDEIGEVRPDLIVMDLMMPGMGGLEAIERIRRMPDFARIPIMVVTASASYGDESTILAAGANTVILKPIELEALLKSMGELLGLTWLHAEPASDARQEPEGAETELVNLPREEIEILHHLARRGNMQDIIARADFLEELNPQYAPFTAQLRGLAQAFQSKAIVALIERYRAMQDDLQN